MKYWYVHVFIGRFHPPSPLELSSQKVNLISIILHSEKGRGEGAGLYICKQIFYVLHMLLKLDIL